MKKKITIKLSINDLRNFFRGQFYADYADRIAWQPLEHIPGSELQDMVLNSANDLMFFLERMRIKWEV